MIAYPNGYLDLWHASVQAHILKHAPHTTLLLRQGLETILAT